MSQLKASPQIKPSINRIIALIVGDFLTLFIFIWIGRISHSFPMWDILGTLTVAAPFLLGWFLVTPWFGLFQAEVSQNWRKLVPRLLLAWAIGGPLALVLRDLFLGRPLIGGIILTFAVIMLVGSTIFLLAWRLGYIWWIHRSN